LGSVKGGVFIEQLSEYQLLKEHTVPWNSLNVALFAYHVTSSAVPSCFKYGRDLTRFLF